MGEFLQNNWFWVVVFVFFIWMEGGKMTGEDAQSISKMRDVFKSN